MKQRRSSFMAIGIPSMFVIFAVLCLVILSLLSLGTSRQDMQSSQRSLEQTTAYYQACAQASENYQTIADYIHQICGEDISKNTYDSDMSTVSSLCPNASWDSQKETVFFSVPMNDEQSVFVEISASWSQMLSGTSPEITVWKTISTKTWNPDTRQPVYQSSNSHTSEN